jgi:thiol-disulfide isomerase/thioredoxin
MKKQIQYTVFIIIMLALTATAMSLPVSLEYKLKPGDQLMWKIDTGVKSSMSGSPGETIVHLKTSLTQIVTNAYEDGSVALIGVINTSVIQAETGGRDIKEEMGKVEDMSIIRQKMGKDGRVIESSGAVRFILLLGFRNQFRPLGVLPDSPVDVGAKWTKIPQEGMDELPVNYTFSGYETKKGYNCAKIMGETAGVLRNVIRLGNSNDLIIEKANNVIYFAAEEGFDIQQNTDMKLKSDTASDIQLNIDMNFGVELLGKTKLGPDDMDKMTKSLSLLESGLDSLNKQDISGAEDIFQNFLSSYKDSPWLANVEKLLSETKSPTVDKMSQLAQQGKLDELLVLAQEAIKSGTKNQKQIAQESLLNVYSQNNRLPELIPAFEKFVNDNPDNPDGYKILGMIYLAQNDEGNALKSLEKSVTLDQNDPDVYASLGFLYSSSGMYEKSIMSYRQSLQLNPIAHYLYPEIALNYIKMGKPDDAEKLADEYKQVINELMGKGGLSGDEAIMQSILADIYTELKHYDEAIELYNKSIAADPRRETYYKQHLAETYDRAEKPELAAKLRESMAPPVSKFIGKPAPLFTLRNLNGIEEKLEDYKGKMVILNFWATWCPYCVKEIPHFIELYEEYKDQGLAIIGISTDRQGVDVVKSYIQKHKINYPILMANLKVQQEYGGVQSIPVTFIIDKEGKIVNQYNGYKDKSTFLQDIMSILGDKSESSNAGEPKPVAKTTPVDEALKLDAYEKIEVQPDERNFTLVSQTPPAILSGKGNQMAPGFVLMDLTDKAVQLSSLKGKVVLLDFWTTWCEPCQKSTSYLESLNKKYKDKGLAIIGMNNESDNARVESLVKGRISYTTILNADKQFKEYSVMAIPSLFYIDKTGKLRYFDIGFGVNIEKEIEQKVLELLAEN